MKIIETPTLLNGLKQGDFFKISDEYYAVITDNRVDKFFSVTPSKFFNCYSFIDKKTYELSTDTPVTPLVLKNIELNKYNRCTYSDLKVGEVFTDDSGNIGMVMQKFADYSSVWLYLFKSIITVMNNREIIKSEIKELVF